MNQKLPWVLEAKEVERRKAKWITMLLSLGVITPLVIALVLKVSFDGERWWADTKALMGKVLIESADTRIDKKQDFVSRLRAKYDNADDAVQRAPENAEAYYNRGKAAIAAMLEDEVAIADFDTAIRLKPDYAEAYFERANTKRWSGWKAWDFNKTFDEKPEGQYDVALKDYDTAIEIRPDYVEAYEMRASLKEFLGQHFDAIQDYDMIIRLKPDSALAYINRGGVKANLGQYDAAIKDYDAAISLNSEDDAAYHSRANAKFELGQYDAAIQDYNIAIRLLQRDNTSEMAAYLKPEVFINRGVAKANLGQQFDAIQDFDIVIQSRPDSALAYQNRGASKSALGRDLAALKDWYKALDLAKKAGDAELQTRLQEIIRDY